MPRFGVTPPRTVVVGLIVIVELDSFFTNWSIKSRLQKLVCELIPIFGCFVLLLHLILISILGFVACFAVSLGPVMWVLFSELFPNRIRGIAISFVGLINSGVSFLVQLVFPWELANLGATMTFAIYGGFAFVGLIIILKFLPETKGKSLEELEVMLVK